ncbi:MAG: acetolactate decarboxylase [Pseudarcicella sp.]|nr:acetolactate decarboxylase [Pseudarcicella sp.]
MLKNRIFMGFKTSLNIFLFSISITLISCKSTTQITESQKTFFQYNIWGAFVNKVFEGNMTIGELHQKGNIGLGSFDKLDGELVMIDGVAYRVREDGSITVGQKNDTIIYADATFFKPTDSFTLENIENYDILRKELNKKIPTPNVFYAFKIYGEFENITLGGLHKQEPPFTKGLDVLIPARPVFKGTNIKGTLIGFYCPAYIGNINTTGYHFHFLADNKSIGGHLMDLKFSASAKIELQALQNYEFRLPESKDFEKVQFDKQFQYNKK